jgi:hypothetical protein
MNVPTPSIAFISHQIRGGNLVAKENYAGKHLNVLSAIFFTGALR